MKPLLDKKAFADRIMNEISGLKTFKENSPLGKNIEAGPLNENGVTQLRVWKFVIKGREATIWEGAMIRGTINIPEEYPFRHPEVKFDFKGFKHIHVYSDGKVCMPLLSALSWDPSTEIYVVLVKLEELIHNEPNPASPANIDLLDMYLSNKAIYEEIIKEQARLLI